MTEILRSFLIGTSGLSLALAAAIALTLGRPGWIPDRQAREQVLRLFLLGVALQCLHFLEELLTGFHVQFPQLLGLVPWPAELFVAFNVAWLAVWVASGVGVLAGWRVVLVPVWFFTLGMVANGLAHPLLALRAGGYFPGLVTSPAVGLLGVVLWKRLLEATGGPSVRA